MNINQLVLDFLTAHVNADEIVMDAETGLPVKAVYTGPDCTGNPRSKPAVFWFEQPGRAW